MVYDTDTLIVYHELTPDARINYQKMLEQFADQLIWNSQHPIKAFFRKYLKLIVNLFN